MAQECKEHICKDGYIYKTIYRVDNEELKEIRKDSDMAFEMHLGIQAMSNGHILLSPIERPGYSDPVYEIGRFIMPRYLQTLYNFKPWIYSVIKL